ncbi:MAG TPA: hypothetical protein PL009_07985, partial [Flavipsychrobacter sp.]|nr:hypothetical protein [Flavipsychrobacter sp.]
NIRHTVFIAGNDPIATALIRSYLKPPLVFAGSCTDTSMLQELQLPDEPPSVVVLVSGEADAVLADLQRMKSVFPHAHLLGFRQTAKDEGATYLLRAGVNGYVTHQELEALPVALLTIAETGYYLNTLLLEVIRGEWLDVKPKRKDIRELRAVLSEEEYKLVTTLLEDPELTNVKLGEKLCKSPSTIEKMYVRIYQRLGVENRTALLKLLRQYTLPPKANMVEYALNIGG